VSTPVLGDREIVSQTGLSTMRARALMFFPAVSGVLLVVLLVGFAKTFFLRTLFDVPPIPGYLYVHGSVLTAWYVLVFTQTCLVAAQRTDLHRRLGIAAVAVASLVVPISAFVIVRYVPRGFARGRTLDFVRGLVVGDSLDLVLFVVLVAAGVYFRRKPDVHKRLMIISCFAIYGPVLARFEIYYGLRVPDPFLVLLPLCVLGIYDFVVLRREHRATMWIAVLVLVVWAPVYRLLIGSGLPDAFITAVR